MEVVNYPRQHSLGRAYLKDFFLTSFKHLGWFLIFNVKHSCNYYLEKITKIRPNTVTNKHLKFNKEKY